MRRIDSLRPVLGTALQLALLLALVFVERTHSVGRDEVGDLAAEGVAADARSAEMDDMSP